jgi:tRNA G18 (ribose-2'-O)-methylase SpoU
MSHAPPTVVVDADDPRLDPFRTMRGRESAEVLWAEGPTVVERLLATSLRVRAAMLSPSAHRRLAPTLSTTDVPVFVVEQAVINAVVGFDLHRGAIAVAERPALLPLNQLMQRTSATGVEGRSRIVVLEGLNDAENLGAIIRSARALGADAMILDPTCADPYYRRTVRVSMGEVFHLPFARAPLDMIFATLAGYGFDTWALTPRPDATAIGTMQPPLRLAMVVGAEGPGLSDAVLMHHQNVRIPVRADVDSLNVGHAVAAALAVVQSSTA